MRVTFRSGSRPGPITGIPRMDDQRRILAYTLRTELGHDRLGRVFRALDTRTMKSVVLRLLRVGGLVPPDREEAARVELRRVLRAAAHVAHPNIAPILDIASWRDLEVVVWDDFGGQALADRLMRGAPAIESLRWAIEAASAITRAHSREVVHGRISLANLIVARDDSVRVLDLGVPRPKAIPFLVEDEPDSGGRVRPAQRNLPRQMRRDVAALAEMVNEIVALGPPAGEDRMMRSELVSAVAEAVDGVLSGRKPTAVQLHTALVEVARRTPADGRRLTGLLDGPGQRPPALAVAARTETVPAAPAADAEPVVEPEPLPFSLSDYENSSSRVTGDTENRAPPLRVWGGAAFEPEVDEDDPEDDIVAFDPREPPPMTTVLLPPMSEGDEVVDDDGPARAGMRIWPHFILSSLAGMLLALGLFGITTVIENPGPQAPPAPSLSQAAAVQGAPTTTLSAGPRPVAPPGQPSGTLVVSTSQQDVQVSVDGSRAEAAPLTWEALPAGRRVIRVTAPGFEERIDTVDVRPNLTTTRFYILAPLR